MVFKSFSTLPWDRAWRKESLYSTILSGSKCPWIATTPEILSPCCSYAFHERNMLLLTQFMMPIKDPARKNTKVPLQNTGCFYTSKMEDSKNAIVTILLTSTVI